MNRNRLTDLEAVAAMPGLEAIADVIESYHPRVRPCSRDPLAMAVYLASKGVIATDSELDSTLKNPLMWPALVASAHRVGRRLPERAPTKNQYERLIRDAAPGLAKALAAELPAIGLDIGRQAGMFNGRRGESLLMPRPENVILADGVGVPLMSRVHIVDGKAIGSRSKTGNPRISEGFMSKPTEFKKDSAPFVAVSAHGRVRWMRVVLGMEAFRDGNEIGASAELLDRVLETADGGVQAIAYDRLLNPVHLGPLVHQHGVIPLVEIPAIRASLYLELPEDLWVWRGERVKKKLRVEHLEIIKHGVAGGSCAHSLWSVDGVLVSTAPDAFEPTLDSTPVEPSRVRSLPGAEGGYEVIAEYRIPCQHGDVIYRVDFGQASPNKRTQHILNLLRPLPEHDVRWPSVHGWRSDVESLFRTIQAKLPDGRATRLKLDHFWVDMIGHALATNAICWDVHVAQHTEHGRRQHARLQAGSRS